MTTPDRPLRLALIGWGAIGQTVGRMLADEPIEIVAVAVRDATAARSGVPRTATLISDPAELGAMRPNVVAEAAGRDSVEPWGRAALELGADFVVSSMSAFAHAGLLDSLETIAKSNGGQIHIQPGALAGVDALSAAARMGIDHVEHRIVKPPKAWVGTPAESLCDLETMSASVEFFSGSANETAATFPKNANVAMTTALAGIGPNATQITLVADPNATTNRHEITAQGAFGEMRVAIANSPLPGNPKTSAMAALNLVRTIENLVNPIIV